MPSRDASSGRQEYTRALVELKGGRMAVYVDNMRAPFRRMIMCHMVADTEEELHAMADKIGVKRKWYQGDHYDICLSKRRLAVKHGAVELTFHEFGQWLIAKRRKERAHKAAT